ncbi:mechanosensitive ion channel family protein [filamentous cyanobacterium CCP5]|nr:mechanosensitive ion channel family protein [filamentous cyanobacterium CCP5]
MLSLAIAYLVIASTVLAADAPAPELPEAPAPVVPATAIPNPAVSPAVPAQSEAVIGNKVDGFPVLLDGEPLFLSKQGIEGVASAQERAAIISQRILAIANNPDIAPEDIRVETAADQSVVLAGDTVLFTVRPTDAEAEGQPAEVLAARAVEVIQDAVRTYREERSVRQLFTSIALTVLSTIALFLFLRGLLFASSKLLALIRQRRSAGALNLRVRSVLLLGSNASGYLLLGLVRLLRPVFILLGLYVYFPFVLSLFPATEALGDSLLQDVAYRLNLLAEAFVAYLPNLAMLGAIAVVTYYALEFVKQVVIELGRADVYPWFYPEWIRPTIRLASWLVVAIACVVAGPYLPGFGSPAFQGISLFIGALVTLGSSSAVANALSGIILIYTRAFRLKDFVRINDIVGEVQDKSLFVTRLLTPKQETVTIPNASVLNNNVTNYSAICRETKGYLLLHTTITLGYDVPWRKVHDVLIDAAKTTTHIQSDPHPFVLQTSLNDFNVSYQLNAYTARPELMPRIYSELHQEIQDKCNAANIEILSPTFSALRDGNHSTLPSDYLPENYVAPSFSVRRAEKDP